MDNQTKTLLITVGLAVVILYIARPKNNILDSVSDESKVTPPIKVSKDVAQKAKDGHIIIEAMKNAIEANEKQSEIDKLNKMFFDEYEMKVYFGESGKLVAKTKEGKIVAKES